MDFQSVGGNLCRRTRSPAHPKSKSEQYPLRRIEDEFEKYRVLRFHRPKLRERLERSVQKYLQFADAV
ncbi:MAG: hypothetical protein KGQ60_03460, partial [Planctomycetes bacterium]|nr:hypothetical protein [Planctomycetota bacterium]